MGWRTASAVFNDGVVGEGGGVQVMEYAIWGGRGRGGRRSEGD